MKYLGCIFLLTFSFSCKKVVFTNSDNPPIDSVNSNTAYVSSMRIFQPHKQKIDSFSFDASKRLTKFNQYVFDTSNGQPVKDSMLAVFVYSSKETTPNSYVLYFSDKTSQTHLLSYDNKGRIIKDTSGDTHFVTYYSYPANKIAFTIYFEGEISDSQDDTLSFTNGNVTSERIYFTDGTDKELSGDLHTQYSSLKSPTYYSSIVNSFGQLLNILSTESFVEFMGWRNYESKNLFNILSGTASDEYQTITFDWTTDNKGNVVKGVGRNNSKYSYQFYYY